MKWRVIEDSSASLNGEGMGLARVRGPAGVHQIYSSASILIWTSSEAGG